VPEGENTSMNTVNALRVDPPGDALPMNAELGQLIPRDDTVLPSSEPRNQLVPIARGDFLTHVRE
jgi:hypothetical protein